MRRPQITPAFVLSALALFVSLAGTTWAATGGPFILGQANSADHQTALTANAVGGAALKVTNAADQPAASFNAPPGIAPFSVSNATRIARLNADLLDGKHAAAFLGVGAKAADANKLDGLDSTAFLGANAKAADSNLLDGLDSTAFLAANGKAADSNLLDGLDSTAFLGAGAKAADADLLDGLDSTQYVHGNGNVNAFAIATPESHSSGYNDTGGGTFIQQVCPAAAGTLPGEVDFLNQTGTTLNVFVTHDGGATTYNQVVTSGTMALNTGLGPRTITIQAQGIGIIQLIRIAWTGRPASHDCHLQVETTTWHF